MTGSCSACTQSANVCVSESGVNQPPAPSTSTLVVGVKLGCINHAMLTAQAVQQAGLRLAGWIANDVVAPGKRHQAYLATLRRVLPAPCLGEIPWLADGAENAETGRYLDLSVLLPATSSALDVAGSKTLRSR